MTKFKRTHITLREHQIDRVIKFLNKSNVMVNYIRNFNDVKLSSVRDLEQGMHELADLFNLDLDEDDLIFVRKELPSVIDKKEE
jgi:myosin-crossreactive antigen